VRLAGIWRRVEVVDWVWEWIEAIGGCISMVDLRSIHSTVLTSNLKDELKESSSES
jgi:hypothetical protein